MGERAEAVGWKDHEFRSRKAHHVGIGTPKDQLGAKSALGKAEWSSAKGKAQDVSSGPKTNRGGFTGTLGGVPSSEEGGLEAKGACCEFRPYCLQTIFGLSTASLRQSA